MIFVKKPLFWIITLTLVLVGFVLNILISVGFFREIIPNSTAFEIQSFSVVGAEDMAIARQDSFMIISSDDRAGRRDGNQKKGGLYLVDLKDTSLAPKKISENIGLTLNPHGISICKVDSVRYRLWVVNHVRGAHSVEVFGLQHDSLWHEQTIRDEQMNSPNDLVAIDSSRFYITNDHGNISKWGILAENYLGLAVSNVLYYDGDSFRQVAENIEYANGINADLRRNLLFVASPRAFQINVYSILTGGSVELIDEIDVGTGVDNLEIDEDGAIWSGGHPQLLKFTAYAAGKIPFSSTEVVKVVFNAPDDAKVNSLFLDDGTMISGGSVALPYGNGVFVGNVMDKQYVFIHDIHD